MFIAWTIFVLIAVRRAVCSTSTPVGASSCIHHADPIQYYR